MSSAVVSTSAALGRPFVFEDETEVEVRLPSSASRASLDRTAPSTSLRAGLGGCPHIDPKAAQESPLARVQSAISNQKSKILPASIAPASRLEIRPAPAMVSTGISALDALTGGLPRGCLTEICGPASSGRTAVLLAALAAATCRGEFCAVVDASDALDPQSAAAAGVDLHRLLWVRCSESSPRRHRDTEKKTNEVNLEGRIQSRNTDHSEHCLEQVLRATDLLLESGGFGLIALDLADLPPQIARRIPLTTWFRFRRAIEHTPTILLTIEQQPIAGSCSSLLLQLGMPERTLNGSEPTHTQLLTGLDISAEIVRSRIERKPARSVTFATKTAWAG
jgi:hypothetical protein